jgi:phosphoserine aminotransferase
MKITKPATKPKNPRFSSGPCTKPPHWQLICLKDEALGRSHRSNIGKAKLKKAIDETKQILKIPVDFKVAIVPASDTGAFEMAMWNLLGKKHVEMLAWENFGNAWVSDVVNQLKIDASVRNADYGNIVDFDIVDFDNDVCFTWNGTTSGVMISDEKAIPLNRRGLTLCDATSAAFAMELPWELLDATTFSWQKSLGGEGGHGVIVLSPRAIERLETYKPTWPLPKIFQLTKEANLIDGIFTGETINTPSMLCVEDYLFSLKWAKSMGGIEGLIERSKNNAKIIFDLVEETPWLSYLAQEEKNRSHTSVCLSLNDPRIINLELFIKSLVNRLERECVAFDIGSHREAPPGLRVWCGPTVEQSDIKSLVPWIKWAFEKELTEQNN